MDVARILAMVRRWWWLLALGTLFSLAAYGVVTRIYGTPQPTPTYAASTTLFATLPPLPDSALNADAAKRPWELDRLIATYAQMAKSRTVAARAVHDAGLATSADDLAARITTDTFGYTQLLRITVRAQTPDEAERSAAAVAQAFAAVRAEMAVPGDAAVYETLPATRVDRPTPEIVNIAIAALAGLLSSVAIVLAFEYLAAGSEPRRAADPSSGVTRTSAVNERTV